MKKVEAFQTEDGKLFTDKGEAEKHQKNINLINALRAFTEKHCYSGMSSDDVYDILYDNREDLQRMLTA
jgi:dsDNA-binding SOS-regulon protein